MEKVSQESGLMNSGGPNCRIDAVVTVDSKGQIVLPKGLRERASFKPNGKIVLISFEKEGEVCCVMMIKAERLGEAVTKTLSPML